MRIEWSENKERMNRRKHRVSFALAAEIFLDPLVATITDARHHADEMRFFSIGMTCAGRLLSVGHSDDGTVIRLITHGILRREKGLNMKKPADISDMPKEIDFSNAERGKFAGRIRTGATMVLLEPDIIRVFPDSESVNAALRMVMRAGVVAASESINQSIREDRSSK